MTTKQFEAMLKPIRDWAREDDESPRRAAVFFMCEDWAFHAESLPDEAIEAIERKVEKMSDEQCCAVCELYNEAIRGQWDR